MSAIRVDVFDDELRSLVQAAADEADLEVGSEGTQGHVIDAAARRAGLLNTDSGSAVPQILVVGDSEIREVGEALRSGVGQIIRLPGGLDGLIRVFVSLRADGSDADTRTVGVTGARGGSGATTVCVGLAAAARAAGTVVVADGDPAGPGLDLVVGLDSEPGIRWKDMIGVREQVAAVALRGRLPTSQGVEWLASHPGLANSASWRPIVDSLSAAYDTVIIDLPRYRLTATPVPSEAVTVLVTTLEVASLANARSLLESGRLGREPVVAVRPVGGPLSFSAAREALADARLVEVPTSRALRGAGDFGDLTRAVTKGAFARACAELLSEARA